MSSSLLPDRVSAQSPATPVPRRVLVLDVVERMAILVLYGFFLASTLGSFLNTWNIGNLLMFITESILVGFVLCRKPAQHVSLRSQDWALAFGATSLPLLVRSSEGSGHAWDPLAINLIFCGLAIQVISKLTLGRRFGIVAANRGICMSGPYRIVRHPIYMGYLFSHVGFLLLNPTWWNLAVYLAVYSLKIPRILAEERLLGMDLAYRNYCGVVRYRMIPGLF
jgi:protein-S-isoprenylcysteine O-methyltransferase Ste14